MGPPGSGKTDTAVQMISNLYHNFPTQKIVVIAHSNTALNNLFEKILQVSYLSAYVTRSQLICYCYSVMLILDIYYD